MQTSYTITIAYNWGRDEGSRRVVSRHHSATAAITRYFLERGDTGWCPRIECSSEDARSSVLSAASVLGIDLSHAVVVV